MSNIKTSQDSQESKPIKSGSEKGTWQGESEIMRNAVAEALDMEPKEAKQYKDKINTILDYAKNQTDELNPMKVKWIVRSIELKLGTPPLSEKRISQVSRYAYLNQEKERINSEINQLNPFEE